MIIRKVFKVKYNNLSEASRRCGKSPGSVIAGNDIRDHQSNMTTTRPSSNLFILITCFLTWRRLCTVWQSVSSSQTVLLHRPRDTVWFLDHIHHSVHSTRSNSPNTINQWTTLCVASPTSMATSLSVCCWYCVWDMCIMTKHPALVWQFFAEKQQIASELHDNFVEIRR